MNTNEAYDEYEAWKQLEHTAKLARDRYIMRDVKPKHRPSPVIDLGKAALVSLFWLGVAVGLVYVGRLFW